MDDEDMIETMRRVSLDDFYETRRGFAKSFADIAFEMQHRKPRTRLEVVLREYSWQAATKFSIL